LPSSTVVGAAGPVTGLVVTGTPGFPASTVSVALQAEPIAFEVLPITLTPQRLVMPSSQPTR
jgi:hypothetical protein